MVCRPDRTWVPRSGGPLLGVEEAVRRASDPRHGGPEAALASDPAWTRPHALLDGVPLPASTRAVARLALHRAGQLLDV